MEGDVYDEADGLPDISSTIPTSAEHFDAELNNNTLNQHEASEYQDDPYAYHDTSNDLEEDDDDNSDDHIFADTMSVNRPESKRPTIDFNPVDRSSTARSPFSAFNHWQGLFSRPSMLVGECSSACSSPQHFSSPQVLSVALLSVFSPSFFC